jgi:hypothetical protein
MTITTTQLGTYTTQISLSGEVNGLGMITALDAAIVAAGWTQWDVSTLTRVYRILNLDGVTYKYIGIYIDPYNGKINTTSYESWNATTHVGTNEVNTFGRSGEMGYLLSNTDVILMVSPYWLLIQTYISNQPSQWSGVVEFQRELSEDISTSVPCFAWICSTFIFQGSPNGPVFSCQSFPRTLSGAVGNGVNPLLAPNNITGGWATPFKRLGFSTGLNGAELLNSTTFAWDTTKKNICSLRPTIGLTEIHGPAVGLKALYNAGSPFNKINVLVDSAFNYSSTGANTEHWLLGETPYIVQGLANPNGSVNGYTQATTVTTLNGNGVNVVDTGAFFYISTLNATNSIQKLSSTGTLGSPVTVTTSPAGCQDLCFDGRYVYAATATGVTQFDTQNSDTAVSLALPNGAATLFYDGTSIWAGGRGSRINNTVYRIAISTFTLTTTVVLPNATTGFVGGMAGDYNGSVVVTCSMNAAFKINTSNNTASNMGFILGNNATNALSQAGVMYDGVNYIFGSNSTASTYTVIQQVDPTTSAMIILGNFSSTVSTTTVKFSMFKFGPYIHVTSGVGTNISFQFSGYFTTNTTALSTSAQSGAVIGSAIAPVTVKSDGAKLYGTGTGTGFFQYTNLNHPDDASVAHGRLAIPK